MSLDIEVTGRRVDIPQRFKDQAAEKLSKVDRFGIPLTRVDVEVTKETNPRLADQAFKVQLTCRGAGPVVRSEAAAADKYSALDLAMHRISEQLRRAHDKATRRTRGAHSVRHDGGELPVEGNDEAVEAVTDRYVDKHDSIHDDEVFATGPVVVREKVHRTQPMSVEDAVTEMELVGHDFFLFFDEKTQAPAVVYRRVGFDYGLLRIERDDSE